MKILITGASGLIGTNLIRTLFLNHGYKINVLTRDAEKFKREASFPINAFQWNPAKKEIDLRALLDVDIVINLAGAGIADARWSKNQKEKILQSRLDSTELLLNSIEESGLIPKKFINASAIGFYGNSEDLPCDESTAEGFDFLAKVCSEWEEMATSSKLIGMKTHIIRIGLVLSAEGGALQKMLPIFAKGLGGKLGDGSQYMSWIHIDDLVGNLIYLINNEAKELIYNGVAPTPVRNKEFTSILGKVLSVPAFFPVPDFILKTLLGEMSTLVLSGQKVLPNNFLQENYKYKYQTLEQALTDIFKFKNKGESIFIRYQWINRPKQEIFDFFSSEKNLELLTPESLKFKVLNKNTQEIEKDTLINYRLQLYGFPLKWSSRISLFEKNHKFIDEQMTGPYNKWIHLHEFKEMNGGTLIADTIVYKAPLGKIGKIVAGSFIRRDIHKIFNYRNKTIHKIFSIPRKLNDIKQT